MDTELRELLERLHDKYNRPEFIECDPISVPHRYAGRTDREIAGFFAATIAWGNRKAIVANGHRMMRCMDDAPADFVRNASEKELASLSSYAHRTFNGGDLRDFVLALRRMEERHGGIGNFFETRYEAAQSMPAVLADFRREFFAGEHAPRCEKHVSSVERGAACKRCGFRHVAAYSDVGPLPAAGRPCRRDGACAGTAWPPPERLAGRRGADGRPARIRCGGSCAVRFLAVRRRHGRLFE